MNKSLFRSESVASISSPEQIYDYIKVSNPAIWSLIGAIAALIAAAAVWAGTASIPVTVSTRALALENGAYLCYISADKAGNLKSGMSAQIDGEAATVERVAQTPLSREEAARTLSGDYAAYALGVSDWNVAVELRLNADGGALTPKAPAGALRRAVITTDTLRPLSFLWN